MIEQPWILFPVLFPLFLVSVWMLVLRIISAASGWSRLAKRYSEERPFLGETRRFESARFGVANYNGMLIIGANASGLYLVPMRIFRPFHRPLLIPWAEICVDPPTDGVVHRMRLIFPSVPGCRAVLSPNAAAFLLPFVKTAGDWY